MDVDERGHLVTLVRDQFAGRSAIGGGGVGLQRILNADFAGSYPLLARCFVSIMAELRRTRPGRLPHGPWGSGAPGDLGDTC